MGVSPAPLSVSPVFVFDVCDREPVYGSVAAEPALSRGTQTDEKRMAPIPELEFDPTELELDPFESKFGPTESEPRFPLDQASTSASASMSSLLVRSEFLNWRSLYRFATGSITRWTSESPNS